MNNLNDAQCDPASFRDPSGFLFRRGKFLFRQINLAYKKDYDLLMKSGLFMHLVDRELLIPHKEVDIGEKLSNDAYRVIQPEQVAFISYPYEWCFSQFKDAAIITLKIQKEALRFGMSLKDCSAYNVQFHHGRPLFIDTLSFEEYVEGRPWGAYKQFCQHFLAPLALMSYTDIRLNQLLRVYIDGIPLDLASSLLPFYTWFDFYLLTHIHLHAVAQKYFSKKTFKFKKRRMSRMSFLGLIDNLESSMQKLKWKVKKSEWGEYVEHNNYSETAIESKKKILSDFLDVLHPKTVWDLGANIGICSRVASDKKMQVISLDADPLAVEKNYSQCLVNGEKNILPLLLDLTNPSSGMGWSNEERLSLLARGPADTVIALALIHHLAISNNVPLKRMADFFGRMGHSLIIEFISKEDSQAQRLLLGREDIFSEYTQGCFEFEFGKVFNIKDSVPLTDSKRILYLMEKRRF